MNTPVSFPLAKLLKEKDIKIDTEEVLFYRDEVNNIEEHQIKNRDLLYNYTGFGNYTPDENEYQTYMISDVVMWLYEKHGIWVRVTPIPYSDNLTHWRWEHMSTNYSTRNFKWKKEQDYMSPTEVYEDAIEYVLTKLI